MNVIIPFRLTIRNLESTLRKSLIYLDVDSYFYFYLSILLPLN